MAFFCASEAPTTYFINLIRAVSDGGPTLMHDILPKLDLTISLQIFLYWLFSPVLLELSQKCIMYKLYNHIETHTPIVPNISLKNQHAQQTNLTPAGLSTLDGSSSTSLTLQSCCPVSLPHHRVMQTHRATASLLLRLVPVYVSHAHPASSVPRAGRLGADGPLGVVLRSLEGERLPRVDERDVQDLPALRAVGGEDAPGANPELDQQVWLEGGGHPGVVQVWWGREDGWIETYFFSLNVVLKGQFTPK